MNNLPLLLDAREAIDYYHQHPGMTDAEKAYVVAFLSGEGAFKQSDQRGSGY